MSRRRAANTGMRLVLARVSQNLSRNTARTPKSAAKVFTSSALSSFGDLVTRTGRLAGAAKRVHGPNRKQEVPGKGQGRKVLWDGGLGFVHDSGNFQGSRVDNVATDKGANHRKGALGLQPRTRFAKPGQVHAGNSLSHGNLRAKDGAAKTGMADTGIEAVKDAILPTSRRGAQSSTIVVGRQGSHENLTFTDTAFGHGTVEDLVGIVVNVGFKSVTLRQSRGGRHVYHHGEVIVVGRQGSTSSSAGRRHGAFILRQEVLDKSKG